MALANRPTDRLLRTALWLLLAALAAGCSINSAKKNYVLAEKLWMDGKYAAAVSEFDKVVVKDPSGKLGLMALQRAASTQAFFLSQYGDAVRKYRTFAGITQDRAASWDAQKQIGEILYLKTEQYDQAIAHYRNLLKLRPDAEEAPEFLFRIGKSHFYLWQFSEAVAVYQDILSRMPRSSWAEKAAFEIGITYFTRGEQRAGGGKGAASLVNQDAQAAIAAYERFLKLFPTSELAIQAKFGIASCYEEMDQLDAASKIYEEIKDAYPSPKVVQIKLIRIRERKAQRNH